MAVTGHKAWAAAGLLLMAMFVPAKLRADQAHDVLSVVNRVTTALAGGNPAAAMAPFDRSFEGYATLEAYFTNLTSSYDIANEADVVDETDADTETSLVLDWTLTLQDQDNSAASVRRRQQVQVRLRLLQGQWKIVDLRPVAFFNPQQ